MFAGLLCLDLLVFAYLAYKYKYMEYKEEGKGKIDGNGTKTIPKKPY